MSNVLMTGREEALAIHEADNFSSSTSVGLDDWPADSQCRDRNGDLSRGNSLVGLSGKSIGLAVLW